MNKAEVLLEGVSYSQFETDVRINFAVVRALEIIGEAAKRLPEELRPELLQPLRRVDRGCIRSLR